MNCNEIPKGKYSADIGGIKKVIIYPVTDFKKDKDGGIPVLKRKYGKFTREGILVHTGNLDKNQNINFKTKVRTFDQTL